MALLIQTRKEKACEKQHHCAELQGKEGESGSRHGGRREGKG